MSKEILQQLQPAARRAAADVENARRRPPGQVVADHRAAAAHRTLVQAIGTPVVAQRRLNFESSTRYLDYESGILPASFYNATYTATLHGAKGLDEEVAVKQVESVTVGLGAKEGSATASYVPDAQEIHVRASNRERYAEDPSALQQTLSGELGAFAHETEHALDHLRGVVDYTGGSMEANENKIRTEWRAWAVEAAVATRNRDKGFLITPSQTLLIAGYASKDAFKSGYPWTRTKKYLIAYLDFNEMREMREFMERHDAWIDEALEYYRINLMYD